MNAPTRRGLVAIVLLSTTLLGGCISKSDYDALKDQNTQLQQQVATQQQELERTQAQLSRLIGAVRYTVNSDLLFAPGSWNMSARGQQIISRLAQKLAPTQQNKLLVAGYTDNTPIGPNLKAQGVDDNQALSEKRAEAVVQFLISQGVKPELVAAKGYGEADPIAPNDTAQGRAKNRRVELSLVPS